TPGPPGLPGIAWLGVGYASFAPYSYWDENPSIPTNPLLHEYYITAPGTYYFEYFIDPTEYWYGTYTIFINPGGQGGPRGEPGFNGLDTYLLLQCDPYGPNEVRFRTDGSQVQNGNEVVLEGEGFTVKMQKTSIAERPPRHQPEKRN
ncbi:MAG: hypothetical protein ACFB10_21220, partial [Salibacteraceae bacterium]